MTTYRDQIEQSLDLNLMTPTRQQAFGLMALTLLLNPAEGVVLAGAKHAGDNFREPA
jgi:hypothetical protein